VHSDSQLIVGVRLLYFPNLLLFLGIIPIHFDKVW